MVSPDPLIKRESPDTPIKEQSRSPLSLANHDDGKASTPQLEQTESAPREDKSASPKPKGPVICGICTTVASKYKCSRCYLPYCSVACNKMHQMNHPPDPKPEPPPTPPRPSQSPAEPTTACSARHPFQILATSDKLLWLFSKYPKLPQQLLDIHMETQPPAEDASVRIPASLRQRMPARGNWSHEKGIRKGKAALRRARQLPGEAGEAVREYCLLVLLLVEENEAKNGARTMLQQQFAQQDADLIRQLMEMEKGGS
ncbi:hypothetical protein L249_2233 [Ophiocordyceps polyrhachis-furcata BCC 54312]|uniref:HIT-type domain-containing protein n=1 Tax=Ophiocordyceps polyrhachis-furcata BCC 54312 TaxID=1330021 RepID=A0A367LQE2_9HYPO|nr:hypothetical protein L249_2233 [Ophiocordyceps polyrhachis-furcata BCC 54312]